MIDDLRLTIDDCKNWFIGSVVNRQSSIFLCLCAFVVAEPLATQTHVAIVLEGATIIDGTGGPPCSECSIVIRGNRIEAVGPAAKIGKPAGAETVDLRGQFILPGLIDHHFHIERDSRLALLQLSYGITAFRDPGQWIEQFDELRELIRTNGLPGPRMSLTGPHLDGAGPAWSSVRSKRGSGRKKRSPREPRPSRCIFAFPWT